MSCGFISSSELRAGPRSARRKDLGFRFSIALYGLRLRAAFGFSLLNLFNDSKPTVRMNENQNQRKMHMCVHCIL